MECNMRWVEDSYLLCYQKGDEYYIVLFTNEYANDALAQFGRWAMQKDLSFTWYDAAFMSNAVHERPVNIGGYEHEAIWTDTIED
jgi:hypothetical protein